MLSIKKYANGGTNANGEKLAQIFSTAASKLGIEPEALIKKAQELQGDAQVGFVQALQDIAENDNPNPQSMQIVQNEFSKSQAFKKGGKIEQFICKHAKGGALKECGCKQEGGTFESEDKQVKIKDFGTAQADTTGTYSYPSTNGEFQFNKMGRIATVWDNTGGWPIHRYADQNWINRHPRRQMLPKFLGGHRELAPAGFFENLVERVNNRTPQVQQNGGQVEKGQDGMYVRPDNLSRRDALELSREHYGFNRVQSRMAYANALNALRNQGLRGRELRSQARRMVAGYNDGSRDLNNRPEQIPTKSIFAQSIDGRVYPQSTMNKALLWGAGPGISPENMQGYIQQNMDANNFSNAFGMARTMGRKVFNWRGNNYGTKLASEVMPRIDTNVALEDVDIPAIEFEPIPNNVTAPSEVATVATARPEIVERTTEIITPGLQSANGNLQNFVPGVMRGSSPYMELRPGENVPRSWYIGPRPIVTQSIQRSAASSSQARPRYSAITGQVLQPGQSEYDLW